MNYQDTKQFEQLRSFGEKLTFCSKDGVEQTTQNYVLLAGSIIFGHREIDNIIRYKLD